MKYQLWLKQNLPFASCVPMVELEEDRIRCNDITFPGEFNPHNVRLWVLGNEYGAMGAVWAGNEQDALDELIDADLGGGILIEQDDIDEDTNYAGNASEPIDTTHLWMAPVIFEPARDIKLIIKFAEARGAAADNLLQV